MSSDQREFPDFQSQNTVVKSQIYVGLAPSSPTEEEKMSTNCSGGNYTNIKRCGYKSDILRCSAADPHHVDAVPDPACHFNADLESGS
jgi:hypothetical protein